MYYWYGLHIWLAEKIFKVDRDSYSQAFVLLFSMVDLAMLVLVVLYFLSRL
jgi:hypothetical protein